MLIFGPLLMAIIPGSIVLTITWWLTKKEFPLFIKMLPGALAVIAAIVLFYIGFVNVRGFEGAAYGFLSFFLLAFGGLAFIIADTRKGILYTD